eukprot:3598468-Pleurochrysis_carterae.AAC.2
MTFSSSTENRELALTISNEDQLYTMRSHSLFDLREEEIELPFDMFGSTRCSMCTGMRRAVCTSHILRGDEVAHWATDTGLSLWTPRLTSKLRSIEKLRLDW